MKFKIKPKGKNEKGLKIRRRRPTNKPVSLVELPDLAHYRIGKRHYRKLGNSHSVDEKTGKDVIFDLRTKVKRVYENNIGYILCAVFPHKLIT